MLIDNYLRIAMMLDENHATSFKANVRKMIKLVLFDSYPEGLCIQDILDRLKESYDLEFSEEELHDAICTKKDYGIVLLNKSDDFLNSIYTVLPDEYEKTRKVKELNHLDILVTSFISEFGVDKNNDEIINIIIRFLYYVFESNYNMIIPLMSHRVFSPFSDCSEDTFPDEEKLIINQFLSWDNREKDDFVYNAVVCCIDFCMMTLKKDTASYKHIFKGKNFYLDANIIFRLAGINGENRKISTESFINKCIEIGINICYTNITLDELNKTIKHHIDTIKALLGNKAPINSVYMQKLNANINLDFYEQYVQWIKRYKAVGNYSAFENDLKLKIKRVLSGFKLVAFEPFLNDTKFLSLCDNLEEFQLICKKPKKIESIKIDINNYLYIQRENKSLGESTFVNVKNYFITADHPFVDWAKARIPSVVPTIVLPSVWYSIMLKYYGRVTKDDFRAFSQFLVLRINHREKAIDRKKAELLVRILDIDESAEIKQRIIDDIDLKLNSDYKELAEDEIIVTSYKSVIQEDVQIAVDAERTFFAIKTKESELEHKAVLESQKQVSYDNGYDEGYINARIETSARFKKKIYTLCFIILIFIVTALAVSIFIWLLTNKISEYRNGIISDWCLIFIPIVMASLIPFVKKKLLGNLDYQIIYQRRKQVYLRNKKDQFLSRK